MSTNNLFSIAVTLVFFGITIQYADNAYGDTNDKLDVNLNIVYLGTRSQKGSNALSEGVIQFPFPLTEHARKTGQGPFGGITYFDIKTLESTSTASTSTAITPTGSHTTVTNNTQLVSEMGLGRLYYSYSVPGDTPYTFVPYVTFIRQFSYKFMNANSENVEVKGKSYLLPGAMYAYRFNERVAFHFDMEFYSYSEIKNNRARIGFSYSLAWPWIVSVSHERLTWDIDAHNVFVDGSSRENNIKIIFRDPSQGNFALTLGHGREIRNATGSALLQPSTSSNGGTYFGIEASGGVLAW